MNKSRVWEEPELNIATTMATAAMLARIKFLSQVLVRDLPRSGTLLQRMRAF